jgi:hypothetical protein
VLGLLKELCEIVEKLLIKEVDEHDYIDYSELIERINKIKTAIEKHNKELEDIQKDLKGE